MLHEKNPEIMSFGLDSSFLPYRPQRYLILMLLLEQNQVTNQHVFSCLKRIEVSGITRKPNTNPQCIIKSFLSSEYRRITLKYGEVKGILADIVYLYALISDI